MIFSPRYAALDALPKRLRGPVIAHPHGTLEDRVAFVVALQRSLLGGRLPATQGLGWPNPALLTAGLEALAREQVPESCRGSPCVTEVVLASMFHTFAAGETFLHSGHAHFLSLAVLAEAERRAVTLPAEIVSDPTRCASAAHLVFDPEGAARAEHEALALALAMTKRGIGIRVADMRCCVGCMGGLGRLLGCLSSGRGFTLLPGHLHALEGMNNAELRALLARIERLNALVGSLGRRMHSPLRSERTVFERITGPMRRPGLVPARGVTTYAPDVRAIERSDDLARMLPSEAVTLHHPQLKWVWHARRFERSLLCYSAEGTELVPGEETYDDGADAQRRTNDRGPVIVCMDTSGSMHGELGETAQAVVIHVALEAHAAGRPCHVITFGGPGEVVEYTLSLGPTGLEGLLSFMQLRFGGGTDIEEPLRRALDLQEQMAWRNADILLVTDGEFGVAPHAAARAQHARKEYGLVLHGLVLGGGRSVAIAEVCDPVHRLADWLADDFDGASVSPIE